MLAMKSTAKWSAILAVACLSTDSLAQIPGQSVWKESESVWNSGDNCRRNALKQFPDYTVETNAKRERSERQCLEANNLPYNAPRAKNNFKGSPQL
jgi:hypothetical protein